jgi:hypothetical protein
VFIREIASADPRGKLVGEVVLFAAVRKQIVGMKGNNYGSRKSRYRGKGKANAGEQRVIKMPRISDVETKIDGRNM